MVFCSKCGKELGNEANFCLQCGVRTLKGETDGVPIPQDWLTSGLSRKSVVCPHCGEKSPRSDAQFCYTCGKQIS
jgi:predicted amidophosphoribosyltransferase